MYFVRDGQEASSHKKKRERKKEKKERARSSFSSMVIFMPLIKYSLSFPSFVDVNLSSRIYSAFSRTCNSPHRPMGKKIVVPASGPFCSTVDYSRIVNALSIIKIYTYICFEQSERQKINFLYFFERRNAIPEDPFISLFSLQERLAFPSEREGCPRFEVSFSEMLEAQILESSTGGCLPWIIKIALS